MRSIQLRISSRSALIAKTPSAGYPQRTEWNVRDSDGTVVFTFAKEPTGGSLKTIRLAKKHGKPCLHISKGCYDAAERIVNFVREHDIKTLNVAGSRESKEPGIHEWVKEFLSYSFFWGEDHIGMLGGPGEG